MTRRLYSADPRIKALVADHIALCRAKLLDLPLGETAVTRRRLRAMTGERRRDYRTFLDAGLSSAEALALCPARSP